MFTAWPSLWTKWLIAHTVNVFCCHSSFHLRPEKFSREAVAVNCWKPVFFENSLELSIGRGFEVSKGSRLIFPQAMECRREHETKTFERHMIPRLFESPDRREGRGFTKKVIQK